MKLSLRTIAILIAFVALALTAIVSNQRAYEAESKIGKGDSWSFNVGIDGLDCGDRSPESVQDEIQGAAYRILGQPEYESIFFAIAPQIKFEFESQSNGTFNLNCESIGRVRKSDQPLVRQYREELYDYLLSNHSGPSGK